MACDDVGRLAGYLGDLFDPHASAAGLAERAEAIDRALRASRGAIDETVVADAERLVAADPAAAFAFDDSDAATMTVHGESLAAGFFETVAIDELRARAEARRTEAKGGGVLTLHVLTGASPLTDVGALQASASPGTMVQVASQFNCLEAPDATVVPVAEYRWDPTQGPRAAWSAWPAALQRHFAAPRSDGSLFTQASGGPQINLLEDVAPEDAVVDGYLTGADIGDPERFAADLEDRRGAIRVGVQTGCDVMSGFDWAGAVPLDASGRRPRIAQCFGSTIAGGMYGAQRRLGDEIFASVSRTLLEATYEGALLAAATSDCRRVILTLIGGGVFGNGHGVIWSAISAAAEVVAPRLTQDLEVIVNARGIVGDVLETRVKPDVRARGGIVLAAEANRPIERLI